MAEKHYNIISDSETSHGRRNTKSASRRLEPYSVCVVVVVVHHKCRLQQMVHCGLEELNKALNFTVFGRRKIGQKIFNIENSTLAPDLGLICKLTKQL